MCRYICTCTYVCMWVYMYVCTCGCMYVWKYVCVQVCMYACTLSDKQSMPQHKQNRYGDAAKKWRLFCEWRVWSWPLHKSERRTVAYTRHTHTCTHTHETSLQEWFDVRVAVCCNVLHSAAMRYSVVQLQWVMCYLSHQPKRFNFPPPSPGGGISCNHQACTHTRHVHTDARSQAKFN